MNKLRGGAGPGVSGEAGLPSALTQILEAPGAAKAAPAGGPADLHVAPLLTSLRHVKTGSSNATRRFFLAGHESCI